MGSGRAGFWGLICLVLGMFLFAVPSVLGPARSTIPRSIDIAKGDQDVLIFGTDTNDFLGNFGSLVVGDFNGDGVEDIAIGAPFASGPGNTRPKAGEVYVVYGPIPKGASIDLGGVFTPGIGPTTIYGADAGDQFGSSLATGDINGDGLDDIIIGAPYADGFGNKKDDTGEVYVILGKSGLPLTAIIDIAEQEQDMVIFGKDPRDLCGSVASGDINGDRIDDIIIGCENAASLANRRENAGEVHVIWGRISPLPAIDLASRPAELTIFGAANGDSSGRAVHSCDVNGDGLDDIIIGAPRADGVMKRDAGRVYVVRGNPSLPLSIDLFEGGDLVIIGGDVDDFLGELLACGDVNGDGISDIIVAARFADGPRNERGDAGEVYVIYGGPTLKGTLDLFVEGPDITLFGERKGDYLGSAVHANDLNSDGIADLIIGAMLAEDALGEREDSGKVYVIFGGSNLPALIDTMSLEIDRPDQFTIIYGAEAGDRLGSAVASGDVDRDGIDDLVIGAVNADGPDNRRKDAGEIYVIFGSAFGRPNTPPVADAGPDQEVTVGTTVQLDGSGSRDPDGDPLNFMWEILAKPTGSVAALSNPRIARPTFVADKAGTYTVKLTVNDGRGGSDTAQVTITAVEAPPGRLKGDVDLDGDVDIIDAKLTAEFIVGLTDLREEQRWAADVREPCRPPEKNIDVTDVRWIAEFSLGLQKEMDCYGSIGASSIRAAGRPPRSRPVKLLLEGKRAISAGDTAILRLTVRGADQALADIQVGPQGVLQFNPKAVEVRAIRGIAPYQVVASKIDNLKGEIRFALTSLNGRFISSGPLMEIEIVAIGRAGQTGEIRLTGFDVLRDSRGQDLMSARLNPLRIRIKSDGSGLEALAIPSPIKGADWIQFRAERMGLEIKVEIYDLSGRTIFVSDWAANGLEWGLVDSSGRAIANGIYLYVISARDSGGRLIRGEVRKLVVTRQ